MPVLHVSEALDQYYKEHVVFKVVARRRQEYAIDHLKAFWPSTPLTAIDIPASRDYARRRRLQGVQDSTIRRELVVLQAAVNHAKKWRRLAGMTADQMPSIELTPNAPSKTLWLYKDELSTLLEAAEDFAAKKGEERPLRFLQLAYHTAGRKASIEGLQWPQVDLEAKRVNLSHEGDIQTKKRRPIVPIGEGMLPILASMKTKSVNQWVLGVKADIRPLFERVATNAGLATLKKRGLRAEGHLSPHILRHSRATHLLQDGITPFAVANLLGDSVETVLRVYGHACPDYLAETLM